MPPADQPAQVTFAPRSAADRRPASEPWPVAVMKKMELEPQAERAKADATDADRDMLFSSYGQKKRRSQFFLRMMR